MKKILVLIAIPLLFFSCQNKKGAKPATATRQEQTPVNEKGTAVSEEHPGKAVYERFCLTCHQVDGSGVPGMHPPLTGTPYVLGDAEPLILILLNGLQGEMEVLGETYNQIMPAQDYLSDKQIADVLSYVRSHFGNDAPAISAEEVKKLRKQNK